MPVRAGDIQKDLQALERRDWWLWWGAVVVMLLLTAAIVSLSLPAVLKSADPLFLFNLSQNVRGLAGLVILFDVYAIYQQVQIKRSRQFIAEQISFITEIQEEAKKFEHLASTDPLTDVYNRRLAEERLAAEVSRAKRFGCGLLVVVLDLNGFKEINDTHGHAAGDLVLKEFARRLKKATRGSDTVARLGGDEFLLLLPECSPGQSKTVLARLVPFEIDHHGQKIQVSFSAGWTRMEPSDTPEALFERADQMLYADKRSGKIGLRPITALT
jgi:diguanylate cyclase (GGDEF)-like protein